MGMRPTTKPIRRPKKQDGERRRREKVHRKRLIGFGVSEAVVAKLNTKQIREMLRLPEKLKAKKG